MKNSLTTVPADYVRTLEAIKKRIRIERLRTVLAANATMVLLYWDIGKLILSRQKASGWGARIIDRMAVDLSREFPEMRGFSPRNLLFMRSFVEAYSNRPLVKQLVSQIPWGHIVRLIQTVKDPEIREWYIGQTIHNGWSRSILVQQIQSDSYRRSGKAITNFKHALPPSESDMASEVFKDPYLFDFLGTADHRREREVEQALVDHVQRFLLELGAGFAFVGRQVLLDVADQEFRVDLLFYHLKLRAYIVIELKAGPFEPAFVGQLNLYLSAADDLLRQSGDRPTIGLLLCRSKNKVVVEYALRHLKRPIGVAQWETQIVKTLPKEFKGSLPSVQEIEKELGDGE